MHIQRIVQDFVYNRISNKNFQDKTKNILLNEIQIKPYNEKKFNTLSYKLSLETGKIFKQKIIDNVRQATNQDLEKITFFLNMTHPLFFYYFFKNILSKPNEKPILSIEDKSFICNAFYHNYDHNKSTYLKLINSIYDCNEVNNFTVGKYSSIIDSKENISEKYFEELFFQDILFENKKFSITKQEKIAHEFQIACFNRIVLSTIPKYIDSQECLQKSKNELQEKRENFKNALDILCVNNKTLAEKEMNCFDKAIHLKLQKNLRILKEQHSDKDADYMLNQQMQYYQDLVDHYTQYMSQYIAEI